jgi:hypothetical protein
VSVEERVDPACLIDDLAEAAVRVGDRVQHRLDPVRVRVVVVVGQREEQEVVEVLPYQLPADASRVGVPRSGPRQSGLAGDPPTCVQLAVEELVRSPDRGEKFAATVNDPGVVEEIRAGGPVST